MIRKITIIIICIGFIHISFAQGSVYPRGGYKNYSELKNKQPSIPYTFNIKKRTKSEIKMNGGAVGGAIKGAEIAIMRDLYILGTSFNIARPLNRAILKNILEPYPHLLQQYQSELDLNEEDVMLKYLIMVNEE